MITIIRVPDKNSKERLKVKMFLPNDENPNDILDFIHKFMLTLNINLEEIIRKQIEDSLEEEKERDLPPAIGFDINESVEKYYDDPSSKKRRI